MAERADEPVVIHLDGKGGGEPVAWGACRTNGFPGGFHWVHLDWDHPRSFEFLTDDLGIDPIVADALVETDTRPRSLQVGGAEMVILRGVNLTPGAEPEDMISLRLMIDERRVVSLLRRELRSISDLKSRIAAGQGPTSPGEFLAQLIETLVDRVGPVIEQLEDAIDEAEDEEVEGKIDRVEKSLAAVRGRIIKLRRFLAPQRDALARLAQEKIPWITAEDRARLREAAILQARYVDDLDSFRDRGQVIQEEIGIHMNRQMTRNTLIVTMAAFILVPLNIVTGLFGMNVGGIPGKDSPLAFWLIVAAFVVFVALVFAWGRRRLR
jgi:zinc transporter